MMIKNKESIQFSRILKEFIKFDNFRTYHLGLMDMTELVDGTLVALPRGE